MKKLPYEAPIMRDHGKVELLTKGGKIGNSLDAAFPSGTPFSALTFS